MATYIASGAGGLEDLIAEELRSYAIIPGASARGAVFFDGPEFPSPGGFTMLRGLNHWARGVDRFGVLLARGEVDGIEDVYDMARALDYSALFAAAGSFAVRARRRGEHEFGSQDVARVVGTAVIEAQVAAGHKRPPVSLRRPQIIVRAEVLDASLRLWFDATGDEPLYQRDYRRQLHPASMRASMAHLMLRRADWRGEPLLDPMCGIGTIPIEAALYARGIAPGTCRSGACAIDRMSPGGPAESAAAEASAFTPPAPLLDPGQQLDVLGIERYEKHVQGAWLNLAAAGPLPGVRLEQGDACRLERSMTAGRYRLALLNPPFGRRVGSTGMVKDLYRRFARAAARCGVQRVVTLAESRGAMSAALADAGYTLVEAVAVDYGDLPAHLFAASLEPAAVTP